MPEVNLENLIRQLKAEGVEKANQESAQIIESAKKTAEQIIQEAQSRAKEITDKAVLENDRLKSSSLADIRQGGRDLVLVVKQQLEGIIQKAFKDNIQASLTPETMSKVIATIAAAWKPDQAIVVMAPEAVKSDLAKLLPAALRANKQEVEIKVDPALSKGFRLGTKGNDCWYDFSDDAIFEAVKELVSPAVKKILSDG